MAKPGKSLMRLVIGAALAVLFTWLILRQIDWHGLVSALAATRPGWVLAALGAFFVGYSCRIARWRAMLAKDVPGIRWLTCAGPLLASFATNNVLPFRAGDVLRAFAFNQRLGATSGTVLATLFVERLLDLLMVLVLLGAALMVFRLDVASFSGLGAGFLFALALAILAVLLFPQAFAPLARAATAIIARFAPGIGARLRTEVDKGLTTLAHLASGTTMLRLVGWSLAAWLSEGFVFWLAAQSLPDLTAPAAGWLALPVGTLATLIPSTPGYVGTFDYFTVHAMTALGNGTTAAAAFAVVVHLLLWLPPTVLGGLYLILNPLSRQPRNQMS
ncbi:lysylphosphatidylglycerol synthase transmembrane domain-containing protein [Silvimonas iriomotensis]|uniref:TIGR00374 family protein n=1 Tax=Silvimonas iriomotensis TaxID=449662 RepID=A0ABQ2PAW7_9NEIS|nr:lysylphosphatidylglycerol synthase transmembrane domain-containing protein [Silvimonas iriomotensis]GGP22092.1 TIGR00374 family protein [Silvimonas iriomotensis]